MSYKTLNTQNIKSEHICCAFSDKKCKEGYELKKQWLSSQFEKGLKFVKLDERAKVFIEFCEGKNAWVPVNAEDYLFIYCFWVSGKYKKNGHGKALLQKALDDAKDKNKKGLTTVVGKTKFHFMSDTKWLLKQGFEVCDESDDGFLLLVKKFDEKSKNPTFKEVIFSKIPYEEDIVIYYSNRCPFTQYHIDNSLKESLKDKKLSLKLIKLDTLEKAQDSISPATIFSMYYKKKFITTDLSICTKSRFDKWYLALNSK